MTLTISKDQNQAVCDGVKLRADSSDGGNCHKCYALKNSNLCAELKCLRKQRTDGTCVIWIKDYHPELLAVAREMLHAIDCPWLYDTPDKIKDLSSRARRVIEAEAEKGEGR